MAYVNGVRISNIAGSATTIASTAFAATTGNMITVMVYWAGAATVTVTDTAGNTYNALGAQVSNGIGGLAQMFYAYGITGNASNVVTATFSVATTARNLILEQYNNLAAGDPLDTYTTPTTGTSTTPTSSAFTTSQANEFVVGMLAGNQGNTANSGAVVRHLGTFSSALDQTFWTVQTGATVNFVSVGSNWIMFAATFKLASSEQPIVIDRLNANLTYSPGNWADNGTSHVTSNAGAYVKFNFTGTSLSIVTEALTGLTAYPSVRAVVDGLSFDVSLVATNTTYLLGNFAAGTHSAVIYLRYMGNTGNWWTLTNALKLVGIQIDAGASISGFSATYESIRPNKVFIFGDSLTQGWCVDSTTSCSSSSSVDDALGTWASPIAEALNAEYGQIGYAGQGFNTAGQASVPTFNTAWSSVASGFSRLTTGLFTIQPDYIVVMHGTNGTPLQSDVATAISNLRGAAPSATIFFIVPGGGFSRTNITNAVNAAITGGDTKLFLIDAGTRYQTGITNTGGSTEAASDSLHYRRRTHARLGAEWIRQIQHVVEPHRFNVTVS